MPRGRRGELSTTSEGAAGAGLESLVTSQGRLECSWLPARRADGPSLVFLHEGLGCVSLWRGFPREVAASTGYGSLVYSRLGYGGSDPAPLPRPVRFMHDEALETLPEVLSAAGLDDVILVGHSDGASIALIFAGVLADDDVRLRGLALEAPHVFVEPICLESISRIRDEFRVTDLADRLRRSASRTTSSPSMMPWRRMTAR